MELENYKEAWKNQSEENNKVSKVDIYKMAHSRSSSIVKWIFIISILEFVVLNSLYFFVDEESYNKVYDDLGITDTVFYSQALAYIILFYFLFKFYLNYKNISTLQNTKSLLNNIVKTRKTVRNYVIFNLVNVLFVIIVVTVASINNNEQFTGFNTTQMIVFMVIVIIGSLFILGILFLFYQLLYGILLRKLKKNFKEISNLELN